MTDADLSGAPASPGQPPLAGEENPEPQNLDGRITELEAKLGEAIADAEKLREDWLRAKAETDNVRRRSQEDVAKAHRFGIEGFASALLSVKDSLDAALTVENTSVESFKEGVELTSRQLESAFEKFAIRAIDPMGEKFDPHRHQAISQVQSDAEPNTVVTVLQKGYLLHDRVLRPALVVVSAPRAA
ncbi:MAG TPA: nucleotide exchange factor GrpE [Usitatibacter sp.]|nr:nucleotide exchange factor GrpE [Usitatibacter sp.]